MNNHFEELIEEKTLYSERIKARFEGAKTDAQIIEWFIIETIMHQNQNFDVLNGTKSDGFCTCKYYGIPPSIVSEIYRQEKKHRVNSLISADQNPWFIQQILTFAYPMVDIASSTEIDKENLMFLLSAISHLNDPNKIVRLFYSKLKHSNSERYFHEYLQELVLMKNGFHYLSQLYLNLPVILKVEKTDLLYRFLIENGFARLITESKEIEIKQKLQINSEDYFIEIPANILLCGPVETEMGLIPNSIMRYKNAVSRNILTYIYNGIYIFTSEIRKSKY